MGKKNVPEGINDLPMPELAEQAHSERLIKIIVDEMRQGSGAIPFSRYMEQTLYAPGLGYYSAGTRKLGEQGDFITAPEISAIFSQCLALQCQQVLSTISNTGGDILEFGAGSGAMAAEILRTLALKQCLPQRYMILDISADLRDRQRRTLEQQVPDLLSRVEWLDTLPENFSGVIVGNEVLDAMPVHRIGFDTAEPYELFVTQDAGGGFDWQRQPLIDSRLSQQAEAIIGELGASNFCAGYESEINLAASDWVRSLASILDKGMILLIDYGFPRREYYHPERYTGTLMCHYRHRAHDDPLILPGLQDITAHVDFTAIAEAALDGGLSVSGYTTQAQFLLGAGLPLLLEGAHSENFTTQLKLSQQIKKLTLPHEMGELFKVIALTKDMDEPLIGFSLNDQRARL